MANSKARCNACRGYFLREDLFKVGLVSVCSTDCRAVVLNKHKAKTERQIANRAKRESGGKPARLPQRRRQQVRNRDGVCRYCLQRAYRMEVHHISYRSQGGEDDVGNLILLCDEHHRLAHSAKRYWQPVLRAYLWLLYAEGRQLSVPQVEKVLKERGLLPQKRRDQDDGLMVD